MKRILLWILGIILVLGVAVAVLLGRIDTQFVINKIADATAKATGKPLIFTSAPSLSLLPPGVKFGQVAWGEIKDGQGFAVSAKGGMAELELSPLLSGNLVIREVRLDNPVLDFREGVPAKDVAQNSVAQDSPADAPRPEPTAPSDVLPVELVRLVVRHGQMRYTNAQGMDLHVKDINLSVENLRQHEEAGLQCDFSFDLKEKDKPALAGNLALGAKLRYQTPNLTFRQISLTFTPLGGPLPKEAGPVQLLCEGALNLQSQSLHLSTARLSTPQARLTLGGDATLTPPTFQGNLHLEGSLRKLAALAGQTLKAADKDVLSFKSALNYAGNTLHLQQIQMQVDDIPVQGDLKLGLSTPLAVSGTMQAGTVDLDKYLPASDAAGTADKAETTGKAAPAEAAPARTTQTGKDMPAVNLRVALAGIRQGGLSLTDISFTLKGEKGRYAVNGLSAALGSGGQVKASAGADLPAKAYNLKATATGVNVGGLLAALGKGRPVEGMAALDADLNTRGVDAEALMAGLSGRGQLEVRDVRLPSIPVLPQGIPGLSSKSPVPDRFDLVRVPFTARSGEVTARPITVSSAGLNAAGQAQASLSRQYLSATADIKTLNMNIPVIIKGPFSDLSYSLDPKFALDMARKLPGALLDGGKSAGGTAIDGATGAGGTVKKGLEGAGGLVRGLFGK